MLRGLLHRTKDGGIVQHENARISHEELETGHAFANKLTHFLDGTSALDYLFNSPEGPALNGPALVLLDLNLPEMSGQEVLLRLRAEPETAAIPVVIVSGDATPANVDALKAAGATDYLTKPYHVKEVLAVIDKTAPSPARR